MPGKSDTICIPAYRIFNSRLQQKHTPGSDKIAMLIHQAGSLGIPETQLRSGIEQPKQLVDELLAALVQSRIVRAAERNGVRWYFSPL